MVIEAAAIGADSRRMPKGPAAGSRRLGLGLLIALIFAAIPLAPSFAQNDYILAYGDEVQVTVYGEDDLSGQHKIDQEGRISLPLVGDMAIVGLPLRAAEQRIADAYRGRFLLSPKVTISVASYRPIYIMGEVKKPGSYTYSVGMTLVNAVALAGGYTYRANEDEVVIIRGEPQEKIIAKPGTAILPGDTIRVEHRFF